MQKYPKIKLFTIDAGLHNFAKQDYILKMININFHSNIVFQFHFSMHPLKEQSLQNLQHKLNTSDCIEDFDQVYHFSLTMPYKSSETALRGIKSPRHVTQSVNFYIMSPTKQRPTPDSFNSIVTLKEKRDSLLTWQELLNYEIPDRMTVLVAKVKLSQAAKAKLCF